MTATLERLRELAQGNPSLNLSEAARIVGRSRERVRQLANLENLPFHRGRRIKDQALSRCVICGGELTYLSSAARPKHPKCRLTLRCGVCGGVLHIPPCRLGRQRQSILKHRSCLMPPVSTPCPTCGQRIQLDPHQRWAFRKGLQKAVTCFACRDGKGT